MARTEGLHLEADHPDRRRPLLHAAAGVLVGMGAEVVIADGDDNLVRSRRPGDPGAAPFVVVASGLPNLLHELVHVLQVGRLADDHAIDYGQIPFDLARADHRRLLWDELAACVLSCAYLEEDREAAWFAEQIGIQGVFFGVGEDPRDFAAAVDRTVAAHGEELAATIAGAYARVAAALAGAGAPEDVARPRAVLGFAALWGRYRATLVAG